MQDAISDGRASVTTRHALATIDVLDREDSIRHPFSRENARILPSRLALISEIMMRESLLIDILPHCLSELLSKNLSEKTLLLLVTGAFGPFTGYAEFAMGRFSSGVGYLSFLELILGGGRCGHLGTRSGAGIGWDLGFLLQGVGRRVLVDLALMEERFLVR